MRRGKRRRRRKREINKNLVYKCATLEMRRRRENNRNVYEEEEGKQ